MNYIYLMQANKTWVIILAKEVILVENLLKHMLKYLLEVSQVVDYLLNFFLIFFVFCFLFFYVALFSISFCNTTDKIHHKGYTIILIMVWAKIMGEKITYISEHLYYKSITSVTSHKAS